jgi:probable F420-dependent oxidoreductase
MATFDAFALATAIGLRSDRIALTVGPLAPAVRDPVGLAMGIASVAALCGRPVGLAVGASSPVVVEAWHGRRYGATAPLLRAAVTDLRALLAGERPAPGGFRLRLAPPRPPITVAAFGPGAVRVAGDVADRMVVNLCTPDQVAVLRGQLRDEVPLAAWVPAAVDPTGAAIAQLCRAVVPYVGAPGYDAMFEAAGFGAPVDVARAGAHPRDVLDAVPVELVEAIGIVGDVPTCQARIEELRAAGADHVAVVPATAGDPGGARTLRALAAL